LFLFLQVELFCLKVEKFIAPDLFSQNLNFARQSLARVHRQQYFYLASQLAHRMGSQNQWLVASEQLVS
jgi:hypothetical protein